MGLTVLITNLSLDWPSGSVVYTRDLALELARQGHRPIVYTWLLGSVSADLQASGIEVVDDLRKVSAIPEVIHGHHSSLVRGALIRFPRIPAVVFCHDHTNAWDRTLVAPRIRRYFGVSSLCIQRLLAEGAPPEQTSLLPNFVDLQRFSPRPPLPPRPERSVVFSNYATAETHLSSVQEACRRLGLPLDVIGRGVGSALDRPELVLGNYDLVFAKAKAAMEAMAVGAAVVLCDFGGVGPMVTSSNFDRLRPLNFGFQALEGPLEAESLMRQVERYDPIDAARVRDLIRSSAGLEDAVTHLVDIYRRVIQEFEDDGAADHVRSASRNVAWIRYRAAKAPLVRFYRAFGLGPRRVRPPLGPAYRGLRTIVRRLLWVR